MRFVHLYGEEQSMKPTEEKIQSNASDLPVYLAITVKHTATLAHTWKRVPVKQVWCSACGHPML